LGKSLLKNPKFWVVWVKEIPNLTNNYKDLATFSQNLGGFVKKS
jgi:hypothetical protein